MIAGFNFVVNSYLYQGYLASALATCSLTTPTPGVLVIAAAVTGDRLSPLLLLSSVLVAAGIGLTVRRLPSPPGERAG